MPSIGGDDLRRVFAIVFASLLVLGSTQSFGAEKRTIKWVASIYSDANGIGLKHPEGVACTDEYLIVADTGNRRLLRYSYQGDGVKMEAEFPLPKSYPIRVHVNSKGDVYFLDGRERRIETMSATGEKSEPLSYKSLPFSTEIIPKSFAIDRNDNIYLLDILSRHVLVLEPDGQYLRRVPFPEEHGFFSDLAVDRQGNILLLDGVEAVVYSAARDADHFSRLTESMKAYVNFPTGISVDESGVIYLVDQYGSGLALVGQDGSFLGRKLGLGWKDSGLYYPAQLCISRNGSMFIADRSNSRVQLFDVGASGSVVRPDEAAVAE
jgi:sugar lactone lactonase YvrE